MLERTEHVTVEACGYGNEAAGMVDRHRTGFDSLCPAISGGLAPDEGQKGAAGCFRRYLDSIPDAERLPLRQIEQGRAGIDRVERSEEHTSELQSLMRISYAVFCLNKKT